MVTFSVPSALLEGFELRECISFIEEHINRQVGVVDPSQSVKSVAPKSFIFLFFFPVGLNDRKSEAALSSVHHRKW